MKNIHIKRGKNSIWNLSLLRKIHWISSAICFVCMLLFAVTGITLNHASQIETKPEVYKASGLLPKKIADSLNVLDMSDSKTTRPLSEWLKSNYHIDMHYSDLEKTENDLYFKELSPGGDAWLSINTESREFEFERTSRGPISYLNNLHKGRHTGLVWVYFMDVFALACVIFSISGFLLLLRYADTRRSTWPLMLGGLIIPAVIIIFVVHR